MTFGRKAVSTHLEGVGRGRRRGVQVITVSPLSISQTPIGPDLLSIGIQSALTTLNVSVVNIIFKVARFSK